MCKIRAQEQVGNIGAIFDHEMTMDEHVKSVSRKCYYSLRNLSLIRRYLTTESAKTLVHSFITCRLDNLNSLLVDLPETLIGQLQTIQNRAARILLPSTQGQSNEELTKSLHWLPVQHRIDYKILLLTFKTLNGSGPTYLENLLQVKCHPRDTRAAADFLALTRRDKRLKTVGDRAFVAAAPKKWNALPINIRNSASIKIFKEKLKTHLFRIAYAKYQLD